MFPYTSYSAGTSSRLSEGGRDPERRQLLLVGPLLKAHTNRYKDPVILIATDLYSTRPRESRHGSGALVQEMADLLAEAGKQLMQAWQRI